MLKFIFITLFLIGCESSTKFKVSQRVTLTQEGYCNGYIKKVDPTNFLDQYLWKTENVYHLELADSNQDCLKIYKVEESKLKEVPPKVTSKQWQEIRSKGPKYQVGTKIKDNRGCIGITSDPYLNDDGEWEYPLSQNDCPGGGSNFSMLSEDEVKKYKSN